MVSWGGPGRHLPPRRCRRPRIGNSNGLCTPPRRPPQPSPPPAPLHPGRWRATPRAAPARRCGLQPGGARWRTVWTGCGGGQETVDVSLCIGRMVQQVCPKGFQRIRYDGVQATKTFAKLKGLMQEALAKVQGFVKGAITIIAPSPTANALSRALGETPCAVRTVSGRWTCGASGIRPMTSSMMSSRPSQGGHRRRQRHAPLPPAALDEPCGPPPEAYLYRCPVGGEERLLNEAIIDVARGAAKFRGEKSKAGCPRWGGPGGHGETMAYVAPEPSSARRAFWAAHHRDDMPAPVDHTSSLSRGAGPAAAPLTAHRLPCRA
jgi:hypothetical protein